MAMRFLYSDAIELLRDSFLDKLEEDIKGKSDPFYSPMVFVPNKHVKKWLQMESARRFGISVNIDFHFFEEGLLYLLKAINPDNSFYKKYNFLGTKEKHIDLQLLILAVILDTDYDEQLAPIYDYLFLKLGKEDKMFSTISEKEFSRRSWQLTEKLALYFREYEYSRQDMIASWRENRLFCSHDFRKIEQCQMRLYNKLFLNKEEKIKALEKKLNKEYTTLPQFSRMIFSSLKEYFDFEDRGNVFIFGISHMSPYHYRLLFDLNVYYGMYLFNLDFLKEKSSYELMNKWCSLIEENKTVLEQTAGPGEKKYSSHYLDAAPGSPDSLLQLLQSKLKNRHTDLYKPQDTSVQVCACPGKRREVETVYNSILYNLTHTPDLKMTDIAVLTTDMEGYLHHIRSVFDRTSKLLKYNLSDSNARADSVFGKALISGLEIARGNMTRKEVFSFITNPCFTHKFSITPEQVHVFLAWVDRLHIYRNYNDKDKYSYKEKDKNLSYTWSGGLRRLRLGTVMTGSVFSDSGPTGQEKGFFSHYKAGKSGYLLPYRDGKTGDSALLGHFIHIMEKLFAFMGEIRQLEQSARKSGRAWSEKLRYFITEFLAIPPEYASENHIYYNMLKDISKLDIFDSVKKNSLNLTYIIEFITSNLASVPSQSGRYLSEGVTISALSRMRPIPFKIIYIIGLNEGDFPGTDDMTTIDLRNITGRPGDFSRVKTGSYLFLEALMSARSKLYLTYRSRNIQKDEHLYPSTLVKSLQDFITKELFPPGTKESFTPIEIPLKGESIEYYNQGLLKSYTGEAGPFQDVLVNYSQLDKKLALLYVQHQLENAQAPHAESQENIPLQEQVSLPAGLEPGALDINLKDLTAFLKSPLDAMLQKHLDLYDTTGEDRQLIEDEPFFSGSLYYYSAVTSTIKHYIGELARKGTKGNTDEYFESRYRFSQLKGEVPEGVFARFDKKKIRERIEKRLIDSKDEKKSLDTLVDSLLGEKRCLYFEHFNINDGMEKKDEFHNLAAPPVINLGSHSVTIRGRADLVFENEQEVHILIPLTGGDRNFSKHLVAPFLFYILLKNLNDTTYADKDLILYKLYSTKDNQSSYQQFHFSVTPDQARDYLKELLADFIAAPVYERLPLEAVLKTLGRFADFENNPEGYRDYLEEQLEKEEANPFSSYNPLKLASLINPPVCTSAYETVKKRYAFFIEAASR